MFKVMNVNGTIFTVLQIPGSNYFWYEYESDIGSDIEAMYSTNTGRYSYGMAHLIEHLSFKSTHDFSSEELIRDLSESCQYNANTTTNSVSYHNAKHVRDWRRVVTNVLNVALNDLSSVNVDEFGMERSVVVNEIRQYNDNPQAMFGLNLLSFMYDRAPCDNILGDAELLSNYTLFDCQQMKRQMLALEQPKHHITYDPEYISIDEVVEFITAEVGRISASNQKCANDVTVAEYQLYRRKHFKIDSGKYTLHADGEQTQLAIHAMLKDMPVTAYLMAQTYIETVAESNLMKKVREERGLTYGISLHPYYDTDGGKFYVRIQTDVRPENTEEMLNVIVDALDMCAKEFDHDAYNALIKYQETQEVMINLNARSGMKLHYNWHVPGVFEFLHAFEESVNHGRKIVNSSISIDMVREAIKEIQQCVTDNMIIVTSQ